MKNNRLYTFIFLMLFNHSVFGQLQDDDATNYESEEIFEYDGQKTEPFFHKIRPEIRLGLAYQSDSRIYRRILGSFFNDLQSDRIQLTTVGGIDQFNFEKIDLTFYLGFTYDQTKNKSGAISLMHEQMLLTFEQRVVIKNIWKNIAIIAGTGGGVIVKDQVTLSTQTGDQVFEESRVNSDSFFVYSGIRQTFKEKWQALVMMQASNIKSGMLVTGVSYEY